MSSRIILGLTSIGGLVVSMALPAFAQTTTMPPTPTTPSTTTAPPTTTPPATPTTPTTPPSTTTCPPGTSSTATNTTTASGNASSNCTNPNTTTPPGANPGTMPQTQPSTSTDNYNALTNNPNGSDWLAKFNRPNVRSGNYLGTTAQPHSMRRMMRHCRYVMQRGVRTKICK